MSTIGDRKEREDVPLLRNNYGVTAMILWEILREIFINCTHSLSSQFSLLLSSTTRPSLLLFIMYTWCSTILYQWIGIWGWQSGRGGNVVRTATFSRWTILSSFAFVLMFALIIDQFFYQPSFYARPLFYQRLVLIHISSPTELRESNSTGDGGCKIRLTTHTYK